MKSSTLARLLLLFSAVCLAWPLAGLTAVRIQPLDKPITVQPPSPTGDQKGGSVLIYNYYNSNSSQRDTDTEISLTNTHTNLTVTARVFFVRQSGGVANTYVCLTSGQTVKLRASDYDPNGSGYVVAVAVDKATGLPLGHNFLVGSESVNAADGHSGRMIAVAVQALFDGVLPESSRGAEAAALKFDGSATGYNQLPGSLALDNLASPADGNDTVLIVNRIGGSLAGRTVPVGAISGTIFNDAGNKFSFSAKADASQLRVPLSRLLPNTEAAIPTGSSAKIELAGDADGAFMGAALNANGRSESFASARNLNSSALADKTSLVIPIGPVPAACRALEAVGADLEMTMTAVPSLSVVRGNNIVYTLSSKNKGSDSAFNVVIRDSLPAGTTFVDATPSGLGSCFVPEVGSPGTVTCTWGGTTGFNVTRSVVIEVNVSNTLLSGSEVVNTGETYSSVNDPNESNNDRTVRTTVTAEPNELVIATQSLPFGKIGLAYSGTLVSVNATAPVVWSITGGVLPDGLLLNPTTGQITGTPTKTGLFPVTFRLTDGDFRITQKTIPIQVVSQFRAVNGDFDGDGKADLTVWRGNESNWLNLRSTDGTVKTTYWGASYAPYFDIPTPGDYDGDGKTDVAVWRPSEGNWYIINSSDGSTRVEQLGANGDTPVPGDYDGDGKTDLAVWRGNTTFWYVKRSSDGVIQQTSWGASYGPYYDTPVPADYDGDGKTDIAVWRGGFSTWYIKRSSDGASQQTLWGASYAPYFDVPVPGDYDGDGKFDIAVWRGSTSTWYVIRSSNGTQLNATWGASYAPYFDIPVPSDYDGDGKTDFAIWRPPTGGWYVIRSTDGTSLIKQHGQNGDTPIPR